jgi:hypothetical protein
MGHTIVICFLTRCPDTTIQMRLGKILVSWFSDMDPVGTDLYTLAAVRAIVAATNDGFGNLVAITRRRRFDHPVDLYLRYACLEGVFR